MIRRASLWDVPTLWTLAQRFNMESAYGEAFPARQEDCMALLRALIFDPTGFVSVAAEGAKVVGMIVGKMAPHAFNSQMVTAHEVAWYVLPEHRAPKLHGPRLKASFEAWAKQGGAKRITMIDPPGAGLGPYYERQGYRLLETQYIRDL